MSSVAGTTSPGRGVKSPLIENFTLTTANTEVAITLREGTRRYSVHARNDQLLKLAYVIGDTAFIYRELAPGCSEDQDGLDPTASIVLYLQSPSPGVIVELETWI